MNLKAPPDPEAVETPSLSGRHDAALRDLASEEPLRFEVRGSSMEPLLTDRTSVDVAPAKVYWPGDVVAFRRRDGRILVHRVIGYLPRRGELMIVLQGDAMSRPDSPIERDRVLGRVCGGDCDPRLARPGPADRAAALVRLSKAVFYRKERS